MNGRIYFYDAPFQDQPLQIADAVIRLVVEPQCLSLWLHIEVAAEPPEGLSPSDDTELPEWHRPEAWLESLGHIHLGNLAFDVGEGLPIPPLGTRLSLAQPNFELSIDELGAQTHIMLFGEAHPISGTIQFEPSLNGFRLRWSATIDLDYRDCTNRLLVEIDALRWDRVDLSSVEPSDRDSAIAQWFDHADTLQRIGHLLVPHRDQSAAPTKKPATLRLAFRTLEDLQAATVDLGLTVQRVAGGSMSLPATSEQAVTGAIWLRPLSRRGHEPDFGQSLDLADIAALVARGDGARALQVTGRILIDGEGHTLELRTLEDAGSRVAVASPDIHLQLTNILESRKGLFGMIRATSGEVAWDWRSI